MSLLLETLPPVAALLALLAGAVAGLLLLVGVERLIPLGATNVQPRPRPRQTRSTRSSRKAERSAASTPGVASRADTVGGLSPEGPREGPADAAMAPEPMAPGSRVAEGGRAGAGGPPALPPRSHHTDAAEAPAMPVGLAGDPASTQSEERRLESPSGKQHPVRRAGRWPLPSLDLLETVSAPECAGTAELERRARIIDETFKSFGVDARVVNVRHGPAVTRFGISPAPGVKVARILALSNDIALRLGVAPLRMEAPVPGECVVGIEVPNAVTETVSLRGLMETPAYAARTDRLKIALGRDVAGKPVVADLAKMPHLLIAGATGSGKSVCLNGIILALLLQYSPDDLQLVLIDPKKVEMTPYDGVPHLLSPVITEMEQVVPSLRWVVKEMERRYRVFAAKGFRNIEGFNKASPEKRGGFAMTYIVVVVDELADLMMTASDEVERILCRLAQLARATGIHLVIATQRPSVDVVTGLIKANFPTRIAFAVTSQVDSRTILDQMGAEKLVGRGDALYLAADSAKPLRLQGAYTSDAEIRAVVEYWKSARPFWGEPRYEGAVAFEAIEDDEADELYEKAEELAVEHDGRLSVSFIQRKLRIGYARAKRLRAALEKNGLLESAGESGQDPDEEDGF